MRLLGVFLKKSTGLEFLRQPRLFDEEHEPTRKHDCADLISLNVGFNENISPRNEDNPARDWR